MLSQSPRPWVELDDFLTALRVNGVSVGPADIDRLRQLFALEPRLDRDGLKSLLSALLVKTPAQREVFERLFADWCPDNDADWPEEAEGRGETRDREPTSRASRAPRLSEEPDASAEREPPRRRFSARLAAAVGGVLLLALLTWWVWPVEIVVESDVKVMPASTSPSTGANGPDDLPATPIDKVWLWQAEVDPLNVRAPWRLGPLELALLGLAALATAGAAGWRYRRRFPDLTPAPRRYVGHGWQPLPPPERDDGALIEARVWAAAVALGGPQADPAAAHSLRVALRLPVSPWQVDRIVAETRHTAARHRLVNWLLRCEPLGDNGLPQPGSLARRALNWWIQRYAEAAQRMQAQENPLLPWQSSLASRY